MNDGEIVKAKLKIPEQTVAAATTGRIFSPRI